jgi:hypothetical protein
MKNFIAILLVVVLGCLLVMVQCQHQDTRRQLRAVQADADTARRQYQRTALQLYYCQESHATAAQQLLQQQLEAHESRFNNSAPMPVRPRSRR